MKVHHHMQRTQTANVHTYPMPRTLYTHLMTIIIQIAFFLLHCSVRFGWFFFYFSQAFINIRKWIYYFNEFSIIKTNIHEANYGPPDPMQQHCPYKRKEIEVYNEIACFLNHLLSRNKSAGPHAVEWSGATDHGEFCFDRFV